MLRINIPYWFERKVQKVCAACEETFPTAALIKTFTEHLRKAHQAPLDLPKKSDFDVASDLYRFWQR